MLVLEPMAKAMLQVSNLLGTSRHTLRLLTPAVCGRQPFEPTNCYYEYFHHTKRNQQHVGKR